MSIVALSQEDVRYGGWIETYTGKSIFPLDPRAEEIDVEDIAHSLSLQCRYNGHVKRFYSVAEHSVLISNLVTPEHALSALMHDASEAYLTDIPRPIKKFFTGYYDQENTLMSLIAIKYGFTWPPPAQVIEYDTRILNDERDQLMNKSGLQWDDYGKPLGIEIKGWSPEQAEAKFLLRFKELTTE